MEPTWTPGEPPRDGAFYVVVGSYSYAAAREEFVGKMKFDDLDKEWINEEGYTVPGLIIDHWISLPA